MPITPIPTNDRRTALHSSWISRLHVTPPADPPPRGVSDTHSDCLFSKLKSTLAGSRGIDFNENKSRFPPANGPREELAGGFGPFRVRLGKREIDDEDEKRNANLPPFRKLEREEKGGVSESDGNFRFNGVKLSPFFQVRPAYEESREGKRIVGSEVNGKEGDESRCGPLPTTFPRSEKIVNGFPFRSLYEQQVSANNNPLPRSSVGYASTSKAYFDAAEDSASRVVFQDPQARHQNLVRNQFKRPIHVNEPEEPFSFWNMGRDKRRDTICSVLPSVAFTWNQSRKRKADAINILPWKYSKK